ncbi:MAG: hypothetical protein ACRDP7_31250, partial [Trebonia sp.]
MTKKPPTPVRFDMIVADRLSAFVSVNHGLSLSSAANMLLGRIPGRDRRGDRRRRRRGEQRRAGLAARAGTPGRVIPRGVP